MTEEQIVVGRVSARETQFGSRPSDLVLALVLFVVLLPIITLVAIAAYRPGIPLIVRRRCPMADGSVVLLYEFNCEALEPRDLRDTESLNALLRVVVHKSRMDQLPQLINVVKGELALLPSQNRASFLTD